jgi:hypothetical protein
MWCVFLSCFEGFCKVEMVAGGLMRGVGFVRYPFSNLYKYAYCTSSSILRYYGA